MTTTILTIPWSSPEGETIELRVDADGQYYKIFMDGDFIVKLRKDWNDQWVEVHDDAEELTPLSQGIGELIEKKME